MGEHPHRADILRLREEGVGPREIARRLEISPNIVAGILHRAGLTSEPSGRGYGASEEYKRLVVAALDRMSWRAVAREYHVSPSTIVDWRRELAA